MVKLEPVPVWVHTVYHKVVAGEVLIDYDPPPVRYYTVIHANKVYTKGYWMYILTLRESTPLEKDNLDPQALSL